jgi:hypothetical protein
VRQCAAQRIYEYTKSLTIIYLLVCPYTRVEGTEPRIPRISILTYQKYEL